MKRFFLVLLAGLLVLDFSVTCMAKLPEEQIALGGIQVGTSVTDVMNIYGVPDKTGRGIFGNNSVVLTYGTSFRIVFADGAAVNINVDARNGIATPAGVTVGMDASVLRKVYPAADCIDAYQKSDIGADFNYNYHSDSSNSFLDFSVKNGKITSIRCTSPAGIID